jgi:DNA-binding transcriptional LysR family regulator
MRNMIEKIENLQALVAVIEAQSLTKAADRLYVT